VPIIIESGFWGKSVEFRRKKPFLIENRCFIGKEFFSKIRKIPGYVSVF
jgi:hypothetical protein